MTSLFGQPLLSDTRRRDAQSRLSLRACQSVLDGRRDLDTRRKLKPFSAIDVDRKYTRTKLRS